MCTIFEDGIRRPLKKTEENNIHRIKVMSYLNHMETPVLTLYT